MKHIVSRDNPHFKALKKLCQSGRERRKTGSVVLDGMHLIESYVQSIGQAEEIIVSESGQRKAEITCYLEKLADDTPLTLLADSLFDELALVETPSGIMAIASHPRIPTGLNQDDDAVLLDGIQDPGNIGSIVRSAAAAGFRQVLLSENCAQVWSPKVLRAAMGAHFQLALHENADLNAFLGGYRGQAVTTTLAKTASSLYELELACPVAWVFGNEGQGVRPELAESVTCSIRIPMPGATESLNVAAAAAICLFETVRQRQALKR